MLTHLKIQAALEEMLCIQNAVWVWNAREFAYQYFPVHDQFFSCLAIIADATDVMYTIRFFSKTHSTDLHYINRFEYLYDCLEQTAMTRFKSFVSRQLKSRFDKSILDYLSEPVVP